MWLNLKISDKRVNKKETERWVVGGRGEGRAREGKGMREVSELAPLSCYRQMTSLVSTGWTVTKQNNG